MQISFQELSNCISYLGGFEIYINYLTVPFSFIDINIFQYTAVLYNNLSSYGFFFFLLDWLYFLVLSLLLLLILLLSSRYIIADVGTKLQFCNLMNEKFSKNQQ